MTRGPTTTKSHSSEVEASGADLQRRKDKRCGGLWRAWVRYVSHGSTGAPDLKALAASLKSAVQDNDPVLQKVKQMGNAARNVGMSSAAKQVSNFGFTSKELRRLAKRDKIQSLWGHTRTMTPLDSAVYLARDENTADVADCLAVARRVVYRDGIYKRQQQALQEQQMREWTENHGKAQVQEFFDLLPNLRTLLSGLEAFPVASGRAYHLPGIGSESCTAGLASASSTRSSNLPDALLQEWRELHQTIQEDTCQPLENEQDRVTQCRKCGYCHCQPAGRIVHAMRRKLYRLLKEKFPGKEGKQKLASADIVLQLKTTTPCQDHTCEEVTLWYHVSYVSFSPYEPVFHVLEWLPDHGEARVAPLRHVLKAATNRGCFKHPL
eukprot:6459272-Amphidinium_carterae.2